MESLKITNKLDTFDIDDSLRANHPEFLILHSTYSYPDFESLLNFHKHVRGYNGLGYHYFISKDDKIYHAIPNNLEGAHALGFNTKSIGLSVFSDKGIISDSRKNKAKQLIDIIQKEYDGKLKVIPHTYAIVEFNNKLFRNAGLDIFSFENNIDIARTENYNKMREEFEIIVKDLPRGKYNDLKQSYKILKNCPGNLFYEIME